MQMFAAVSSAPSTKDSPVLRIPKMGFPLTGSGRETVMFTGLRSWDHSSMSDVLEAGLNSAMATHSASGWNDSQLMPLPAGKLPDCQPFRRRAGLSTGDGTHDQASPLILFSDTRLDWGGNLTRMVDSMYCQGRCTSTETTAAARQEQDIWHLLVARSCLHIRLLLLTTEEVFWVQVPVLSGTGNGVGADRVGCNGPL
jgi:hypothetical protein